MDNITILLIVLACIFMLLALVLLIRYLCLKAELKRFKEQIKEIRTTDREQPIKVASFGVSSVTLAEEINLLIAELRNTAKQSADAEQRLRTIMAGVSHDFRTPLTSADGYLQMTEEMLGKLSDPQLPIHDLTEIRDYLKIVSERIHYLRSLSDEFFEVTYIEAKKDLPLEDVRFDTLLSDVLLAQVDWIETSGIRTDFRIPEEQMVIRADRHYLERILENLLSNARKYTKSRLEISVEKTDPSSVILCIQNDIDTALQLDPTHIFEPFYRAKGRSGPGTGLGLYVCRELAEAMHFELTGMIRDDIFQIRLVMPKALLTPSLPALAAASTAPEGYALSSE